MFRLCIKAGENKNEDGDRDYFFQFFLFYAINKNTAITF